jgi:hypothetical protein
MVDEQTGNLKCPVCRTNHFREVETLPVNYALLEIAESHKAELVCEQHGKEFVGFCQQDHELICGICMFEHRNHEAFPINSSAAEAYVKANAGRLNEVERQLKDSQASWAKVHKRTAETQSQIGELVSLHISGIREAEQALLKEVQQGAATCITQLKRIVMKSDMAAIATSVSDKVARVKAELRALQQSKSNFSALPILQKLQMLTAKVEVPEGAQLGSLKQLRSGLATQIDYEACVRQSKFPMEL